MNTYDDEFISRTQRKRESTALQRLGKELSALSPNILDRLPLPKDIKEAIHIWHNTSTHEGKRRQMQYIGRLMREIDDIAPLENALAKVREDHNANSSLFKHIEELRDTILATPPPERSNLLQKELAGIATYHKDLLELAKKADNETANGRPPHAKRALFRLLKAQCINT